MLIAMTLTPDVYVRSIVYFPAPLGWALVSVGLADELVGTYIPSLFGCPETATTT